MERKDGQVEFRVSVYQEKLNAYTEKKKFWMSEIADKDSKHGIRYSLKMYKLYKNKCNKLFNYIHDIQY